MKEEGINLENKIHIYQENYISLADFEDEIEKRESLMMIMKKKL